MKDKQLREFLKVFFHAGNTDSTITSHKFDKLLRLVSDIDYEYVIAKLTNQVKVLEKKSHALIEHLKLEEVYIPTKESTYTFRKIKK